MSKIKVWCIAGRAPIRYITRVAERPAIETIARSAEGAAVNYGNNTAHSIHVWVEYAQPFFIERVS